MSKYFEKEARFLLSYHISFINYLDSMFSLWYIVHKWQEKHEIKNTHTSALNRWMPLLELPPSMYISARLRRPYDLCVLNQTYDMAWLHVLPRSDSSFLCPRTSCIYMHGNLTYMHYIKSSIGLMSWSSNSKLITSNLSFTTSDF